MTAQNFPDKHQANSLPVRLGGKEGAEEFSFGLFTYPRTIVNDFDRSGGSGPYYYLTLLSVFSGVPLYTSAAFLMIFTSTCSKEKHPYAPFPPPGRIPDVALYCGHCTFLP